MYCKLMSQYYQRIKVGSDNEIKLNIDLQKNVSEPNGFAKSNQLVLKINFYCNFFMKMCWFLL